MSIIYYNTIENLDNSYWTDLENASNWDIILKQS